uniref:Uncharacterized protein n=1 Tax=Anopheles culicifacies TaxID=139723 RepID=A0A182MDF1_9DIPT
MTAPIRTYRKDTHCTRKAKLYKLQRTEQQCRLPWRMEWPEEMQPLRKEPPREGPSMPAGRRICLAVCVFGAASAGVVPVAAPLAAAGVVAPYATSYNAHTVNHAVAAPVVAAAPAVVAAPAARFVAAPAGPAVAYTAAAGLPAYSTYAAGALPAFSPYTAFAGLPAPYVF